MSQPGWLVTCWDSLTVCSHLSTFINLTDVTDITTNAAFGSGCKYRKYKFPNQKLCLVYLSTRIYYLETRRFQQYDNNSNFKTMTFAMQLQQMNWSVWPLFCSKRWLKHCKRLLDALSSTWLPIIRILVTFSTLIHAFRRLWAYFQAVYRSTLPNASYSYLSTAAIHWQKTTIQSGNIIQYQIALTLLNVEIKNAWHVTC